MATRSSLVKLENWHGSAAELGDDGTNDLLVSEVLRTNEPQVWFLSEHLVDVPLITATA
jgi:starvation-inducible DNA-binding protein